MLPSELIYEISVFLSPKDLVKLSLCSRHLRRIILENQCIWRTQYYTEWPAFFTPNASLEDALFPAPTWIQTFFMRKLAEVNIEAQKKRQFCCNIDCRFFRDLAIYYDCDAKNLAICKGYNQKVVEFRELPELNLGIRRIQCGSNIVICSDNFQSLYCFSLKGEFTQVETAKIYELFAVDRSRFIGVHKNCASVFTITPEAKLHQHQLGISEQSNIAQVYGRHGHCITVKRISERSFIWKLWIINDISPKPIMEKTFVFKYGIHIISRNFLASRDFIFIPFSTSFCIFVYVYSLKEDAFRIIKIKSSTACTSRVVAFYASALSNMIFRRTVFYDRELCCVCFSGTRLEELKFSRFDYTACVYTEINQISRRLQLVLSAGFLAGRLYLKHILIDMKLGVELWTRSISRVSISEINGRYMICNRDLYDYSSEKCPEITDWFYRLLK